MNVLMFHSVGNDKSKWCQNWLSVSLIHFEQFCKYLARNKYQTLWLDEWYDLQNTPSRINKKQIVLTFDDGYLDNWVFVYPLLKKYNLKGTIFINPEFVDLSENRRNTIEDVWSGIIAENELISLGFLNWSEIQYMDKSGVIDIQNHSMSHNYYFYSDKIIDFYQGQDIYHWLAWIENPNRKYLWITENQKDLVSYGVPIFEYGRALGIRQFLPSDNFIKEFKERYYQLQKSGISHEKILNSLKQFSEKYKIKGRYETEKEMKERFIYELSQSKCILERKLNKKIDYLCWPGGGYNDVSLKIAEDLNYKASTIASKEKYQLLNNTKKYKRIQRNGMSSIYVTPKGKKIFVNDEKWLIKEMKFINGHFFYKNLYRMRKLIDIILCR